MIHQKERSKNTEVNRGTEQKSTSAFRLAEAITGGRRTPTPPSVFTYRGLNYGRGLEHRGPGFRATPPLQKPVHIDSPSQPLAQELPESIDYRYFYTPIYGTIVSSAFAICRKPQNKPPNCTALPEIFSRFRKPARASSFISNARK